MKRKIILLCTLIYLVSPLLGLMIKLPVFLFVFLSLFLPISQSCALFASFALLISHRLCTWHYLTIEPSISFAWPYNESTQKMKIDCVRTIRVFWLPIFDQPQEVSAVIPITLTNSCQKRKYFLEWEKARSRWRIWMPSWVVRKDGNGELTERKTHRAGF